MFLLKNSSQRTVGFWLSVIGWLIFTFSVGYAIPSGNTVTTVLLSGAWVLLTGSMVSLFSKQKRETPFSTQIGGPKSSCSGAAN